jgi:serine/threonine protein kinase
LVDIWSFGILYYRVIIGEFPFTSNLKCRNELFRNILNKKLRFPQDVDKRDKEIVQMILKKTSTERLSMKSIIEVLKIITKK